MATRQRKSRKAQQMNQQPKLDERFITTIQGKDFVIYAGLLDLAHQKGLLKLHVEPIQYPTKENGMEAICRAVAESKTGEIFSDIGDANPSNVHSMVSKHILRIASTRAKARVLRDMVNFGTPCLDELGELDEVIGDEPGEENNSSSHASAKKNGQSDQVGKKNGSGKSKTKGKDLSGKEKSPSSSPKETRSNGTDISKISEAQQKAILSIGQRKGMSSEELEAMAIKIFNTSMRLLSSQDASAFIRELQKAA